MHLHTWEMDLGMGMSFNPSKRHILRVARKRELLNHTYHLKGSALETADNATYFNVDGSVERLRMAKTLQQRQKGTEPSAS